MTSSRLDAVSAHLGADKQQLPGILVGDRYPGVRALPFYACTSTNDVRRTLTLCRYCTRLPCRRPTQRQPCSEEAVEYDELDVFLRLKESWSVDVDEDRPAPVAKPVGVPGAVPVSQMTPEHHKPKIFPQDPGTPLKPVNKRNDFDISTELEGFGLQGVRVTDDDLQQLVKDLGLEGDEAADMVRSLGGEAGTSDSSKPPTEAKPKAETGIEHDKAG